MELYIIRHAEAEYPEIGAPDKGRSLTINGRRQAEELGRFFSRLELKPEIILTSPYVRTVETAQAISAISEIEVVQKEEWLVSGMAPGEALDELKVYSEFSSVILIGHQPDLGNLIQQLDLECYFPRVPVASVHRFIGCMKSGVGEVSGINM